MSGLSGRGRALTGHSLPWGWAGRPPHIAPGRGPRGISPGTAGALSEVPSQLNGPRGTRTSGIFTLGHVCSPAHRQSTMPGLLLGRAITSLMKALSPSWDKPCRHQTQRGDRHGRGRACQVRRRQRPRPAPQSHSHAPCAHTERLSGRSGIYGGCGASSLVLRTYGCARHVAGLWISRAVVARNSSAFRVRRGSPAHAPDPRSSLDTPPSLLTSRRQRVPVCTGCGRPPRGHSPPLPPDLMEVGADPTPPRLEAPAHQG